MGHGAEEGGLTAEERGEASKQLIRKHILDNAQLVSSSKSLCLYNLIKFLL